MRAKVCLIGIAPLLLICTLFIQTGCTSYSTAKESLYETLPQEELGQADPAAGYAFGSEDAPVTVIEYSSYECKDCAQLHTNLKESLARHVENGEVRYVFKPVVNPKFENDAEISVRLAPKSIAEITDVFSRFDEYAHKDFPAAAQILGLGDAPDPKAAAVESAVSQEVGLLRIDRTPTLIIGNRKYTEVVFTADEFDRLIQELKDASLPS